MDCHNRPAHTYQSPNDAVNLAMSLGQIDRTPAVDQNQRRLRADPQIHERDAGAAKASPRISPSQYPERSRASRPADCRRAADLQRQLLPGDEGLVGQVSRTTSATRTGPAVSAVTTASTRPPTASAASRPATATPATPFSRRAAARNSICSLRAGRNSNIRATKWTAPATIVTRAGSERSDALRSGAWQ